MDEMKEIEKNEETGTPSETPSKPVEEPPILPSIEDVAIGYQVKKPVETQAECDVYSVVVAAVTKHNETAVSGDYYWMITDLDDCYEVQQHEPVPSEDMKLESLKTSKMPISNSMDRWQVLQCHQREASSSYKQSCSISDLYSRRAAF